jgi:hypothetical protein
LNERIGANPSPAGRARYEARLAHARNALKEEQFERAWIEGRALSLDRALAYALEKDALTLRQP